MAKRAKKAAKKAVKKAKKSVRKAAKKVAKKAAPKRAVAPKRGAAKKPPRPARPSGRKKARGRPQARGVGAAPHGGQRPPRRPIVPRILPRSMPRASPSLNFAGGLERLVGDTPALQARVAALEESVHLTVALPTMDGEPIQHHKEALRLATFEKFRPRQESKQRAVEELKAMGFEIIRQGRFGVTIKGPARLVAEVCQEPLMVQARARRISLRATQDFASDFSAPEPADLFVAPTESLSVAARMSNHIDHFVFTPPPIYFQAPNPPPYSYHGIDDGDIRRLLNVPTTARGAGVRVALVDTGFYPHPYYSSRGLSYTTSATPGAPTPQVDGSGHGTAIAYNVFAVAPDVDLVGYQQTDPPQDAMESAADEGADILSCSWGWNGEQVFNVLQATILSIIAEGKVVLFAAGNGHTAWPGSQPEVLSIGGVYADASDALEASDYASGFTSTRFAGRRVPDVSGLCGQRPKGIYIMMPTQPGSGMDASLAGPTFPYQDETGPNDGWVGASGTSSATPQVAGVVALMLQKARASGVTLTPSRVRQILERSCVAISKGSNAMRHPATGQPNLAVGWGLVDAGAALAMV